MGSKYISKNTLKRIPFYLEYLKKLKNNGETLISSTAIARGLELNDVQVRKDLALVSATGGKPKIGYEIDKLIDEIESFLGYRNRNISILIGVGSLGKALLGYKGFKDYGLSIVGAFDISNDKIGEKLHGVSIMEISRIKDFCIENNVHIGIITVPQTVAQEVCDILVDAGVKAIWNFAPVKLKVPSSILVQNENMASSLAILSAHLNKKLEK